MTSLTLRGLLWVIGTFISAYHNYYLSEVCYVGPSYFKLISHISPNPNSYWSELSLQHCFIYKSLQIFEDKRFGPLTLCLDIAITLFHLIKFYKFMKNYRRNKSNLRLFH